MAHTVWVVLYWFRSHLYTTILHHISVMSDYSVAKLYSELICFNVKVSSA